MAAERQRSASASCSGKSSGFSYANAVLNFKNDENIQAGDNKCVKDDKFKPNETDKSNKENERDNENVNKNIEEDKTNVDLSDNTNVGVGDQDDDFINYSGSKRKKKIAKMKKKENDGTLCSAVNKSSPTRHDKVRPKRKEKVVLIFDSNETPPVNCDNVKYVAAPVPKVNPWTKNKNAASVLKGEVHSTASSVYNVKPSPPPSSCKYAIRFLILVNSSSSNSRDVKRSKCQVFCVRLNESSSW